MQELLSMSVLFFAVIGLIDGGFVTWQGRGRARAIGIVLLVLAIFCLVLFIDGTFGIFGFLERLGFVEPWGTEPVTTGLFGIMGALIGFAIPTGLLIVAMLD